MQSFLPRISVLYFALFLSVPTCLAWSSAGHSHKSDPVAFSNRRQLLERGIDTAASAASSTGLLWILLLGQPQPARAAENGGAKVAVEGGVEDKASAKEEADRRKKEEKEARRIAEETKKRLAVGRIGTI